MTEDNAALGRLAMATPVLPPSAEELQARQASNKTIVTHYSEDAVNARLEAIERQAAEHRKMRDQSGDILPEIAAKIEADRKAIASTIASGQSIVPDAVVAEAVDETVTPEIHDAVAPETVEVAELPRPRPYVEQESWTRRD
jgi:hypothetical protein